MKKLIAMIGAVAMSFCAFADEPAAKPGISFEAEEPGVSEGTFTPSEAGDKWSWPSGDPLELGEYANGELAAAGVYGTGFERRDDEFPKVDTNQRYLKLDTGTAELIRTNDAPAGAGYVDQLVKFTGFEDPQTNLTAGIGVWMSEFVTNDTEDVELTETNLYVTVGKGAEQIALKIDKFGDDDFVAKVDQWYRLTIKPIGDVFGNAEATTPRAGFIVYINGKKVSTSDNRAQALIDNPSKMTVFAKEAMENGQLFTAVTDSPAAHTLAGFKGVGAIDDIILTDVAPAFTIETVDVTFAPIDGAIIASVVDSKGITAEPSDMGVYTVNPGVLTVTLAADEGYKMRGDGSGVYHPDTKNAQSGEITLDTSDVEFVEVVATVENDTVVDEYAEDELYDMITTLVDGDTATFIDNVEIKETEEGDSVYAFSIGTTIDVSIDNGETTWMIESKFAGDLITDNVGAGENFIKYYTFADDTSTLLLGGDVAGGLEAPNVSAGAIEVSGVLKASALSDGPITLSGTGKVMSETPLTYTGDEKIFTNDDIEEIAPVAPDTYYTYQIKTEPPPAEDVVTITIGSQTNSYPSAEAALAAVWAAEQDESNYPIIVKATAAGGLTINYNEQTAQIAQNDTITINLGSWAFSGALAYKGRIDGAVSATDVTVLDGGITLGANGSVTVDEDSELETDDFSADQGYKVIVEEGEGTKTFKTQQDSPTPTGKPGISFEDGESGVQGTTFDPSLATGNWTWNSSDPLEIGDHDGETLPYGDLKPPRRDTLFPRLDVNNNYLKLDTSSEELAREMDNANGYVDQLIKFTGYEDIQTNFAANTKIAVWMGEICTNDDTEAMSTNLYITVGREISGSIEQVALKIDGDYKLDSWYRLTVKPIGNIYAGQTEGSVTPRAGFAVYIDGKKIGSSDLVAKALVENPDKLSATAKTLLDAGQLFTAIDDTSVDYGTVAWKGIGAIDDIILTAEQPEFTIDEYGFTITPPLGLEVESVKVGDTVLTEYKVAPNTVVTITFRALPGWKITGNNSIQRTISSNGQVINDVTEITVSEAAAYVVNASTPAVTNYYLTAELLTMVNGLVNGDTATFIDEEGVVIKETEEGMSVYEFSFGTTIDVSIDNGETTWMIESKAEGDLITDNAGVGENFIKVYTFADATSTLALGGNVAGGLEAPNVSAAAITVSGVLKAATLSIDTAITLDGTGKVMCENKLVYTGDGKVFTNGDIEEIAPVAPDTYYTYQIAAAPGTFTVTVPDLTAGLAFVAMTNGNTEITTPAAGSYTVNDGDTFTVVYAPAEGYEFTELDEDGVREATKNDPTITPPTVALQTFTVKFATVENGTVETSVTNNVAPGTEVTVTATPGAGYKCTEITTNGTAITGNTFVMPAEDVTVGATFTEIKVTAITLNKTELALVEGGIETLTATVTPETAKDKTIAWTTSDAGVATVANGAVTAVAEGTATITATNAASGKFATCTVTVSAPAPTVYFPQADIEPQWVDRDGTEAKPFVIRKYEDLVALKNGVANGTITTQYFEQVADIDMSATATDGWVGIGTLEDRSGTVATFKGVYDGGNKQITNLTFSGDEYNGLFASAYGATIKNLKIAVAGIKGGGAAAFVGCASNCAFTNLTSTGSIGTEAAPGTHTCAGIAVRFEGSTAYACTNKCEIWNNKGKLGGLFGIGQSATPDYIYYCSNEGEIHSLNTALNGDSGVGGIFGVGYHTQPQKIYIDNCSSTAEIYSADTTSENKQNRVGSMVGRAEGEVVYFSGKNITLDDMRVVGSHDCGVTYGKVLADGLVELCAASDFAAGETYKTMKSGLTPAYTFTDAGMIAFNTNMYAATAFNVTAGDESLEVTETAAEGVVTFTAAIKTFNVTFKPENGSADIVSNNVAYGTAFADVAPKNLEKTGYDFAGWDPVVERIDGTELEFTAQWTAIQYTLTLTGGENVTTNVNPEKATYTYGETVAITATPKTGFTYEGVALGEGWGLNEGGAATNTVTITGNASVAIPNAKKAAITVTVKKGTGIASVSVGGTPLDFDATTSEATFEVSADAPTAQVTLAADDITIPVYKMSIGNPVVDSGVTNKTPVITADANDLSKNYFTFTAEEAKADDPKVTEEQKKQAIIDSIDDDPETHDAAVAKVNAIVTTETTPAVGKVTASELATWITDNAIQSADLAASDYVVASVKLDTDSLIDESTEVKIADLEEVTGGAMTFKVEIDDDPLESEKQLNAIKDMVKATKDVADWTTAEKRLEVTATANVDTGTVTITPKTAQDKAFMKVVIQQDPEGVE